MIIQPYFANTTTTPSWRCQCPHDGQTTPPSLSARLWQARAPQCLTRRLHTFHTRAPQPLSGLLEWPWWL